MSIKLLALYFLVGGITVSVTTYYGSQGKGLLAAFIGMFPGATIITFCAIYFKSGASALGSYSRGLLILLPPWVLYVLAVYLLSPRLGLIPSLALGIATYAGLSFLVIRLTA